MHRRLEEYGALDPRREFFSRLGQLPSFIVTVRSGYVTVPATYPTAELSPVSYQDAHDFLQFPATGQLAQVARSPLYLNLAGRAQAELAGPIPVQDSESELRTFLWQAYLQRVFSAGARSLAGWRVATFQRWLTAYSAAAVSHRIEAISFQRWPLLYGPRTRVAIRILKATMSACVLALPALPVVHLKLYGAVVGVLSLVFVLAGEGSATRPMAIRRFGVVEFVQVAARQWAYVLGFVAAAVALSLLATDQGRRLVQHLAPGTDVFAGHAFGTVLGVGVASAALLGIVPALYELFYVPDHAADHWGKTPASFVVATAWASVFIGVVGGAVAFVPLYLLLNLQWAPLAVPVCILIGLMDSLASPSIAATIWALQGRGPLRVNRFLDKAQQLRLVRSFGQFYLPDHNELLRALARQSIARPLTAVPTSRYAPGDRDYV